MECSGWVPLWRFVHALNSLEFNFVMSGWKKHPFAIFCGLERAYFPPSLLPSIQAMKGLRSRITPVTGSKYPAFNSPLMLQENELLPYS